MVGLIGWTTTASTEEIDVKYYRSIEVKGFATLGNKESSAIQQAYYSRERSLLIIVFHHGGAYRYCDVDYNTWLKFSEADSIGKAYHKIIKGNVKFTCLGDTNDRRDTSQ